MDHHSTTLSVETLLDALMVLYDECCTSSFKKEKTVQDFASSGMWYIVHVNWCVCTLIVALTEHMLSTHYLKIVPLVCVCVCVHVYMCA